MADEALRYTAIDRERPVRVVPYGVSRAFQAEIDAPRPFDTPYVMSVSSLDPHKNYEDAIAGFAAFKRRHRCPHVLCLLGGGPARYVQSLKRLAVNCGAADAIHFLGHAKHDDLPAWYHHADAFLLTSACESFGLPLIEAMASGTPVVAARRSGLVETAAGAAVLVEPSDHNRLSDELARVLTDDAVRQDLRQRGLAHAANFTWVRAARSTLEILLNA